MSSFFGLSFLAYVAGWLKHLELFSYTVYPGPVLTILVLKTTIWYLLRETMEPLRRTKIGLKWDSTRIHVTTLAPLHNLLPATQTILVLF